MTDTPPPGDRIAKVLARAGVASRRDAERMIEAGRIAVNGRKILSPALNVTEADRITLDGAEIGAAEPPRLWLYHKPSGLVTTARDEKGRETVFDTLPDDMPRVMSVGRLDLNSEGLLILTNDGDIKRRMELPTTGWVRKYRVRVNGSPKDEDLAPLRRGITVEGETFQGMTVTIDRQQGANAWLTVSLREGRNREIRRAMEAVGLPVSRLIRISYGPFRLGDLKPGAVEEVKPRVVRDQLGLDDTPRPQPQRRRKPGHGDAPKPASERGPDAPRPARSTDRNTDRPAGKLPGKSARPGVAKPRTGDAKGAPGRSGTGKATGTASGPRGKAPSDGQGRSGRTSAPEGFGTKRFAANGPRSAGSRAASPRSDGSKSSGSRTGGPNSGGQKSGGSNSKGSNSGGQKPRGAASNGPKSGATPNNRRGKPSRG
ncbi:pseudouridine synthase [Mesobaculum littorinae]|uniref:Pseudouridine synthase n=1 Tax=Mesobaculum littorinae TaxID=2486419 RepID=A0A438AJ11_9RHOB|nr:pseudouridine synthase [Mesobaculum littorinae]RVV98597.1 pseudouridine synthase [Mesobaculum littorinae]